MVEKVQLLRDRLFTEFHDIQSADRNGKNFLFQTASGTIRARNLTHAVFNFRARPFRIGLTVATLQIADDTFKWLLHFFAGIMRRAQQQFFLAGSVQNGMYRLCTHLFNRRIQCKVVSLAKGIIIHLCNRSVVTIRPSARLNRAFANRELFVRNDAVRVDFQLYTETGAGRAGTIRIVKRKHARCQLFNGNPAVITCIVLRE